MKHFQLKQEHKEANLRKLESKYTSRIGFATQEGLYIVLVRNILYLQAFGNYTQIKLKDGKTLTISKTLKSIEVKLPKSNFRRCHRSFIINLDEVVKLHDTILLSCNVEVPISRRMRKEFKSWYKGKAAFI